MMIPFRPARRAEPAPLGPPPAAAVAAPEPAEGAGRIVALCAALERQVDVAVADVAWQSADSRLRGNRMERELGQIEADAEAAAGATEAASRMITKVAGAAEELSATGREIAGQAARSVQLARQATAESAESAATIEALARAAESIGTVVKLIRTIAARTNLLALNATIEAARAGEAGRGFAVVAAEVKALSRQTREATEEISRRVGEIQEATGRSVLAIRGAGAAVEQIETANSAVAAALGQQDAAVGEIARAVQDAAGAASEAAASGERITRRLAEVRSFADQATRAVKGTEHRVAALRATLVASLRQTVSGAAEAASTPLELDATVSAGGRSFAAKIFELSPHAAMLRPDPEVTPETGFAETARIRLDIPGLASTAAEVLGIGGPRLHLRLLWQGAEGEWGRARLEDRLAAIGRDDSRFAAAVTAAARRISAAFEGAVAGGEISEHALFDTTYTPIPGTDPPQYMAPCIALTDRVLPAIQDPLLAFDPRVVFCAAVDRNGYFTTHNPQFSQPQRPDDPAWNAGHCRNRRIINDGASLAAARSEADHLLQFYERDMGNGVRVPMKEAAGAIRVNGRHWGALRCGYRAA